jgi:hypothetical protein
MTSSRPNSDADDEGSEEGPSVEGYIDSLELDSDLNESEDAIRRKGSLHAEYQEQQQQQLLQQEGSNSCQPATASQVPLDQKPHKGWAGTIASTNARQAMIESQEFSSRPTAASKEEEKASGDWLQFYQNPNATSSSTCTNRSSTLPPPTCKSKKCKSSSSDGDHLPDLPTWALELTDASSAASSTLYIKQSNRTKKPRAQGLTSIEQARILAQERSQDTTQPTRTNPSPIIHDNVTTVMTSTSTTSTTNTDTETTASKERHTASISSINVSLREEESVSVSELTTDLEEGAPDSNSDDSTTVSSRDNQTSNNDDDTSHQQVLESALDLNNFAFPPTPDQGRSRVPIEPLILSLRFHDLVPYNDSTNLNTTDSSRNLSNSNNSQVQGMIVPGKAATPQSLISSECYIQDDQGNVPTTATSSVHEQPSQSTSIDSVEVIPSWRHTQSKQHLPTYQKAQEDTAERRNRSLIATTDGESNYPEATVVEKYRSMSSQGQEESNEEEQAPLLVAVRDASSSGSDSGISTIRGGAVDSAPAASRATRQPTIQRKPFAPNSSCGTTGITPMTNTERVEQSNDTEKQETTIVLPPLHAALYRGASLPKIYQVAAQAKDHPQVMEQLDRFGNTPLHIACMGPSSRKDLAAVLTSSGASQEPQRPGASYDTDSLLLVIQLFYNLCPHNIQRRNCDGNLPLHLAVLSATASATTTPSHCQTVSVASQRPYGTYDTASTGVNIATTAAGGTSQMWLEAIGKIICEYPQALHLPNRNGQTPLDLALQKQSTSPDLVALIQEEISMLGDNFNCTDGRTTLLSSTVSQATPAQRINQQQQSGRVGKLGEMYGIGGVDRLRRVVSMEFAADAPVPEMSSPPTAVSNDAKHYGATQGQGLPKQPIDAYYRYPPLIAFEDGKSPSCPPRRSSMKLAWNLLGPTSRIIDVMQTKMALLGVVLLTFVALLLLPQSEVHHHIRVAFIGNSIVFVNDLPRFMEALSAGHVSQNSCLHGATRLRTILYSGNGMYNKWQTENAIIKEVSVDDDLYGYIAQDDDDVNSEPYVIYDYGSCSVPQLLYGTDDTLEEYNANGQYKEDGKNPCIEDPAYLRYLHQRYIEIVLEHRDEEKQVDQTSSVLHLWDYVVLNDQTLVPAIDSERELSAQVLKYIYAPHLKKINARPVLLMTHAYSYDAQVQFNEDYEYIWQDIPSFTSALYKGYMSYADALAVALPPGLEPLVAPAGLAYLVIWEENRSMWQKLFYVDGFHPTPHGTFLMGCVLYATLYNRMPANIPDNVGDLFARARRMEIGNGDDTATTMPMPSQDEAVYLAGVAARVALKKYIPKSLNVSSTRA